MKTIRRWFLVFVFANLLVFLRVDSGGQSDVFALIAYWLNTMFTIGMMLAVHFVLISDDEENDKR